MRCLGDFRPEFDSDDIHQAEQLLCAQMRRLGLSDEQQYKLFDSIWDIADTISIQRRQDGYREAMIKAREIIQQAQMAP